MTYQKEQDNEPIKEPKDTRLKKELLRRLEQECSPGAYAQIKDIVTDALNQ